MSVNIEYPQNFPGFGSHSRIRSSRALPQGMTGSDGPVTLQLEMASGLSKALAATQNHGTAPVAQLLDPNANVNAPPWMFRKSEDPWKDFTAPPGVEGTLDPNANVNAPPWMFRKSEDPWKDFSAPLRVAL